MINLKDNPQNIETNNIENNDYNDYDNEGEYELNENNNENISNSKNSNDKYKSSNSISSLSQRQQNSTIIGGNTVYIPPWKKKLRNFLDSPIEQLTMAVFTVYVLFADDIKVICTKKNADPPFSIIVIILMAFFFIELVLSAIAVEDYFLGFYFWLDFISLISMVLDIHWFYDWMINSISGGGSGVKKAKTIGAIAKAGKSAKIAARAIRILRVLRIIRLVRISKLYKAREQIIKLDLKRKEIEKKKEQEAEKKKKMENEKKKEEEALKKKEEDEKKGNKNKDLKNKEDMKVNDKEGEIMILNKQNNNEGYKKLNINEEKQNNENEENKEEDNENDNDNDDTSNSKDNEDNGEVPEESKVGKLLADRTTKKVIILILSMMIGIILFNTSFYLEKKTGMEMGLKIFTNFNSMNDPDINLTFSIYVSENLGTSSPLVYAKVGYLEYANKSDADALREQEKNAYSEDCSQLIIIDGAHSICEAIFDVSEANRLSALLNIIKTCFICVVLTVSSYCLVKILLKWF